MGRDELRAAKEAQAAAGRGDAFGHEVQREFPAAGSEKQGLFSGIKDAFTGIKDTLKKHANKIAIGSMFTGILGSPLIILGAGGTAVFLGMTGGMLAGMGIIVGSLVVGTIARVSLAKQGVENQESYIARVAHAAQTGVIKPREQEQKMGSAKTHETLGVQTHALPTPSHTPQVGRQLVGSGPRIG